LLHERQGQPAKAEAPAEANKRQGQETQAPPATRTEAIGREKQPSAAPSQSDVRSAPTRTAKEPEAGAMAAHADAPDREGRPGRQPETSVKTVEPQHATRPTSQVALNPTTTFAAKPNHGGIVVEQKKQDGSQVVVSAHSSATGHRELIAYQRIDDPARGTQARVYLDGHRVVRGHDFVTYAAPHRLTVTRFNDGRRDEFLPDGRRVSREEFAVIRDHDGRQERILRQTVFAAVIAGTAMALDVPVVNVYHVVPYHGVAIYTYTPVIYQPPFYDAFGSPYPAPIAVAYGCPYCPSAAVAYDVPPATYSDPTELVADLQLSSAMDDGMNALPATLPDPAVQDLQTDVAALQDQIAAASATNEELKARLADQQDEVVALQTKVGELQQNAATEKQPVHVSNAVRQQIRKEVQQDIALHKEEKPLSLVDIIASAEARDYIFQISEAIDATTADDGEECLLTTGDLVKFEQTPGADDAAAQMKVVTSKPTSCKAGDVIQVSLADLQEMLNGFSQRLEANMSKVHDQVASLPTSGKQ
jgi:hypothetical protein